MFTVGEFATLARVSKRLLRYYDEINLLKPAHTDHKTGYRYYSAEQMAQLNRILVLKELGLSLEQIRRMMSDAISADEMQGMLMLKKAEIEQALRAELRRIQKIEARLGAIRNAENNVPLDVIIKNVPTQSALSVKRVFASFDEALHMHQRISAALPERSGYGLCFVICHDDEVVERNMTLEMGRIVETASCTSVQVADHLLLEPCHLPAVPMMATIIVSGGLEVIHAAYGEMALWVQSNGYRVTGRPRELTLQATQGLLSRELVTELQFPVAFAE